MISYYQFMMLFNFLVIFVPSWCFCAKAIPLSYSKNTQRITKNFIAPRSFTPFAVNLKAISFFFNRQVQGRFKHIKN